MICRGCGNTSAYHVKTRIEGGEAVDICDECGRREIGAMPTRADVYWPGYPHFSNNLADEMGRPILLQSREHKAAVMKKLGVRELGDRQHGSRSSL